MQERTITTPFGPLRIVTSDVAVVHVWFGAGEGDDSSPLLDQAVAELSEWLRGERREFTLPLAPQGTPFQLSVWEALRGIPYGETRTYAELAATVGRPSASRAVGAANGRNPLPILVPCHRVIGAGGSLTGFGGGIPVKRWLLAHEQRYAERRDRLL
ncbi:MAG: methylated-DNA--protein-cysteine methyltransferase [Myxococcales bacterium]